MHFGFSYVGLIYLVMLFAPNIKWARNKPKDYDRFAKNENKILLMFERTGEILTSAIVLVFSDFNIHGWKWWNCWLIVSFVLMILYEMHWYRYFKSEKTMRDQYSSFCGFPVAGATLPVLAFFLLGIYGSNLYLIIATIILGIGHIGIHVTHEKEAQRADETAPKPGIQLESVDIGDYETIKGDGMLFHVRVYDAQDAGRLFLMDMKVFGGLMRMETVVFTPVQLDGPIYSMDKVKAFGRATLVLELYDTTVSHPDFNELNAVKQRYSLLPSYDPGDHPYYTFRLPVSDYKRGFWIKNKISYMAEEYGDAYFQILQTCPPIDPEIKKAKNSEFSECLFQNGGPAVNQFKKMIGEEKTEEFLKRYMFCSR